MYGLKHTYVVELNKYGLHLYTVNICIFFIIIYIYTRTVHVSENPYGLRP